MLDSIKDYAKDHNIPIILDEGLLFIKEMILKHQVKTVLEIGTAIGYSALHMALLGCHVDTMERDLIMIELAKENLEKYDLHHQVNLISTNALTYDGPLKTYDLIFIDAAKAQYQKFFDTYINYLNPQGIVICDNLDFHHLDIQKVNRNTRQLMNKINQFKNYLKEHPDFETTFIAIGDGMSLSIRKRAL